MADLPPGWSSAPLREIADSCLGKMLDRSKNQTGELAPYLRNTNVRWGRFDLSDVSSMYFEDGNTERYRVRQNDVLICEGGEPGRAAVWPHSDTDMRFQKALHRVRVTNSLVPSWLVHSLRNDASSGELSAYFTGTTIKHLTGRSLARYLVRLPPPKEQERIVDKLGALQARSDAAKAALDAIPALLDKFRQSVLAAAFRGDLTRAWRAQNPDVEPASVLLERIRAERRARWIDDAAEKGRARAEARAKKAGKPWSDEHDAKALERERAKAEKKYKAPEPLDAEGLPELPEGWCWAAAAELVEPGADIVYGIVQPGREYPDGVPYVRGRDIRNGEILVDQLRRTSPAIAAKYSRAALRGGDVLLGIIRATKVAVVPDCLEGANLTQGTARFRPSSIISTLFLAAYLDCPSAQSWLHARYRGIDMPGLNLRDVRQLPIPLCPEREQTMVVSRIQRRTSCVRLLDDVASASDSMLRRLNQSILAKAFRGELVPQDPNDEPASVLLERIRAERAQAEAAKPKRRRRKAKAQATLPGIDPEPTPNA